MIGNSWDTILKDEFLILDDDYVVYAVDHREPTLKELSKTYDVSIHIDTDIKGKYNIRNYKKLEK